VVGKAVLVGVGLEAAVEHEVLLCGSSRGNQKDGDGEGDHWGFFSASPVIGTNRTGRTACLTTLSPFFSSK